MVLWCGVCCGTVCLWSLWGDRIGMFGQKVGIWNVFDPSTWQAPPSRTRLRDLMKQYACIAARVHAMHAVACPVPLTLPWFTARALCRAGSR